MADEEPVNRDQHRADLAELRLEFKEELHGVRQDVAVLAKSVEQLALLLTEMRTQMDRQFAEARQERRDLRQEMQTLRRTVTGQLWTMIGVVAFAVLTGVIKLVLFP